MAFSFDHFMLKKNLFTNPPPLKSVGGVSPLPPPFFWLRQCVPYVSTCKQFPLLWPHSTPGGHDFIKLCTLSLISQYNFIAFDFMSFLLSKMSTLLPKVFRFQVLLMKFQKHTNSFIYHYITCDFILNIQSIKLPDMFQL
jgi:hypothetical protein